MSNDYPYRKQIRLKDFDYSKPIKYFLTVCTKFHDCILSEIKCRGGACSARQSEQTAYVELSSCGSIAEDELLSLPFRFPNLVIDKYVIMPNHIHMIIELKPLTVQNELSFDNKKLTGGASSSPTVPSIMRAYKSIVSRRCHSECGIEQLFQRSFFDRIIRNEKEYFAICHYIKSNPKYWQEDELYCDVNTNQR